LETESINWLECPELLTPFFFSKKKKKKIIFLSLLTINILETETLFSR
jgi:hypothetical protein